MTELEKLHDQFISQLVAPAGRDISGARFADMLWKDYVLPAYELGKKEKEHLLEHDDGHIRIDCWCEPELVHVDGNSYLLHKDENGNTILNDPKFENEKE